MSNATTPPRQAASARPASGTTPSSIKASSFVFLSGQKISEVLQPAMKTEVQDKIRVVNTEEFFKAFLAPVSLLPEGAADQCLEHLKTQNIYDGTTQTFAGIRSPKTEKQMYSALTVLMNEIPDWYLKCPDSNIPLLVPNPEDPSELARLRLAGHPPPQPRYTGRRHRFVYGREKLMDGHSSTKCDIYMILTEEDTVQKSTVDGRDTWVTSLKKLTWPDVRIPIEVKKDTDLFDPESVVQITNYFRNLKHAQPDRLFYFTMSINSTQCRLWRWDASACYVTEPILYHQEPAAFINLMARLASLSPAQLGYDRHFLNAGLLLDADRVDWKPHVQLHPSSLPLTPPPTPPGEDNQYHPRCCHKGDGVPEIYRIEEAACSPHGVFGRNTCIWRATKIGGSDAGATVAIKQAWQDAGRENEANFFHRARNIESGVARMRAFEAVVTTSQLHLGVVGAVHRRPAPRRRNRRTPTSSASSRRSRGGRSDNCAPRSNQSQSTRAANSQTSAPSRPLSADTQSESLVTDRILQRMVFNEFGRALTLDDRLVTLLGAMLDALRGYQGLLKEGILHRDISAGNIMSSNEDSMAKHLGFLIDLGLSQSVALDPLTGEAVPEDGATPHADRTGTLPFMSHELLNPDPTEPLVQHLPRHDLESFFWVLIWHISPEEANLLATTDEAALRRIKFGTLAGPIKLRNTEAEIVTGQVNALRKLLHDKTASVQEFIKIFEEMYQIADESLTFEEPKAKRQRIQN